MFNIRTRTHPAIRYHREFCGNPAALSQGRSYGSSQLSNRSAALPRSILALHGGALVDTRDLPCTNANHANVGWSVLFTGGQSVGTMRPVAAPCPRQIALLQNHRPPG